MPLVRYRSTAKDGQPDAVVVIDPLSTGARLAKMALDRGFAVIRVMSGHFPPELIDMIPVSLGRESLGREIGSREIGSCGAIVVLYGSDPLLPAAIAL